MLPTEIERHFWKARLVKGGVYIPVMVVYGPPLAIEDGEEVWADRSWRWQALVRLETTARAILTLGEEMAPVEVDGNVRLRNLARITEADYRYMIAHCRWATEHAPDSPDASPTTPVDWNRMKAAF